MPKRILSFAVDSDSDRDIIDWYDGMAAGRRSAGFREAIRAGLDRNAGATLNDVLAGIDGLRAAIRDLKMTGIAVADRPNDDIPEDILDNLAGLGR